MQKFIFLWIVVGVRFAAIGCVNELSGLAPDGHHSKAQIDHKLAENIIKRVGTLSAGDTAEIEHLRGLLTLLNQNVELVLNSNHDPVDAGIAHDVRSPMGALSLGLDMMEWGANELETVKAGAKGIEEILLSNPARPAFKKNASSNGIFKNFRSSVGSLSAKGTEFIPVDAVGNLRIEADMILIQRALNNLINNAILHGKSPEGRVTVRLVAKSVNVTDPSTFRQPGEENLGEKELFRKVYSKTGGDYVVYEVTDSGPGVPSEKLRDLGTFTTKEGEGGHGIGLDLVMQTVESHHGFMEVRPHPSTFRLYIPLKQPTH